MTDSTEKRGLRGLAVKAAVGMAVVIAVPAEGLYRKAYRDPVGILTVCYGHTGKDVVAGKTYSMEECKAHLDKDMLTAVQAVEQCVPNLPEPVLAAFGDAVFNIGPRVACDAQRSTAARYLKAGNLKAACNELPKWNKARVAGVMVSLPGLTKRRAKEQALCLQGVGK